MNEGILETIKTVCWAVVALQVVNGAVIYTVVRLLMTGRQVFERRPQGHVADFTR